MPKRLRSHGGAGPSGWRMSTPDDRPVLDQATHTRMRGRECLSQRVVSYGIGDENVELSRHVLVVLEP